MKSLQLNLDSFILMSFLCLALLIGIFATWRMPIFSDSAYHASVIREVVNSGTFPVYSPIGWTNHYATPLSYSPFFTQPPLFYTLGASLNLLGFNLETTLTLINIIPSVLTILFFYKFISLFFTKKIAIYSTFFLIFMPMNIWLLSHRLMEPLQYLLGICSLYYLEKFNKSNNLKYLLLISIFFAAVLYIKITSLFLVLAAMLYLFARKVQFKKVLLVILIVTLLYTPYALFSITTRGTIAYAPPGFPVIDKYLFNPWWNWEKTEDEKQLAGTSDQDALTKILDEYDKNRRDFIQKDFINFNFFNILQNFTIYPVSESANAHWFSSFLNAKNFYLFMFSLGILIYLIKFRKSKYHLLIIPLLIFTLYYLTKVAELRYFFILNILLVVSYGIALNFLFSSIKQNTIKIFIFAFVSMTLFTMTGDALFHSYRYRNSLTHNLMPEGAGVSELESISKQYKCSSSENVFTNANSEIAYYLNCRGVWDNRLFFIPENEIEKYLDIYNVRLLILPNYLVKENTYSAKTNSNVDNLLANWEGSTIPLDSPFYRYLNSQNNVEKVKEFISFTIYRRIK